MKSISQIELGATIKEIFTGYVGVAIAKTLHINGCHRVTIQKRELEAGQLPKAWSIDVQQVELVPGVEVIKAGNIGLDWGNVKLGVRARDLITGFEGIVVSKTEWFGGKKRVGVQSRQLHEGKLLHIEDFDVTQVEVLDPTPIFGDVEKELAGPGGPFPEPTP